MPALSSHPLTSFRRASLAIDRLVLALEAAPSSHQAALLRRRKGAIERLGRVTPFRPRPGRALQLPLPEVLP